MHWHRRHADARSLRERLADRIAAIGCSFNAFGFACLVVLIWVALGPRYDYSDTWQLVINTGTTIVTFLMAFLIGANQMQQAERDRHHAEADYQVNLQAEARIEALQLHLARIENDKLDEIIRRLPVMKVERSAAPKRRTSKARTTRIRPI